jgi:predicted transcriptional regulator
MLKTEKQKAIVAFLQANPGEWFASEIADGCGLEEKSVRPVLSGLAKATKERADIYVEVSEGQKEVLDKDGNKVVRTYKKYALTEAGKAIVIE